MKAKETVWDANGEINVDMNDVLYNCPECMNPVYIDRSTSDVAIINLHCGLCKFSISPQLGEKNTELVFKDLDLNIFPYINGIEEYSEARIKLLRLNFEKNQWYLKHLLSGLVSTRFNFEFSKKNGFTRVGQIYLLKMHGLNADDVVRFVYVPVERPRPCCTTVIGFYLPDDKR